MYMLPAYWREIVQRDYKKTHKDSKRSGSSKRRQLWFKFFSLPRGLIVRFFLQAYVIIISHESCHCSRVMSQLWVMSHAWLSQSFIACAKLWVISLIVHCGAIMRHVTIVSHVTIYESCHNCKRVTCMIEFKTCQVTRVTEIYLTYNCDMTHVCAPFMFLLWLRYITRFFCVIYVSHKRYVSPTWHMS